MQIFFGLSFDDLVYPLPTQTKGGTRYLGPQELLQTFEAYLGLSGHPNNIEYLRIEQYRQILILHLSQQPNAFYAASFRADQFATATELLDRRDELLLAGWNFQATSNCPNRLKALAQIEALRNDPSNDLLLSPGFAERFTTMMASLDIGRHPIKEIWHNEPFDLLPFHFQRLFNKLKDSGLRILPLPALPPPSGNTDLDLLKTHLLAAEGPKKKKMLQGDGTLLIIKGKRENQLAHFMAKIIRDTAEFQPLCLIPEKNRALDHALMQEGLPSLGILTASLSRPTLQVLKLVPVFLWDPIDPYKIMEFVSLAVKPLDSELANRIAFLMAERPGMRGEGWYLTIRQYFDEIRARSSSDPNANFSEIEFQYNFWFERKRFDIAGTVPKEEVIEVYQYLSRWARQTFDQDGSNNQSLLFLSEQAKRIWELLEALPENQLSNLELERIVRTIYEPAPVQFQECELGHLPHIFQSSSIFAEADQFLWWNFIQHEPAYFFPRWYKPELAFLQEHNIHLLSPKQQNQLLVWQRKRPVFFTKDQLILAIPQYIAGSEKNPHPLYGDLQAAVENLKSITFNLDTEAGKDALRRHFQLTEKQKLPFQQLGRPKAFIRLDPSQKLQERESESLSSLETLLYYPYQWVFRHKIKLKKSSILSIVKGNTLLGKLAHRFFENLLKLDVLDWDRTTLDKWVDQEAQKLLKREGAILLMYGREPERVNFIKKVKFAAWSLINTIRQNDWQIAATEESLKAPFQDKPINGRADLRLERGTEQAIIDLKWRGARFRERMIRNEEDLQLVLYARLLNESGEWAHTAFFIMETGQIISRNQEAFRDGLAVAPEADHQEVNERIFHRMEATYKWRLKQIQNGFIEIRCEHTLHELEDQYGAELLELLEMKTSDAPFDDYRTLINLIE